MVIFKFKLGDNMEKQFKFSIIMSVYNVENYIEEAIDSVISQTLDFKSNIELILVNDGSTDNSEEICLSYQKKFPSNIKVISKPNGGLSSSRNCGLKHVTGEYVNFLDPDDILSDNTLERVYDFFKKHEQEIDFVAIPLVFFGRKEGDHLLNYKFEEQRVIDLTKTPDFPHLSAASAFFKRDVITKYTFTDNLSRGEDALVINKLLLDKKKYGVVNNVTYWYRQRFDNTSMLGSAKSKESNYTPLIKNYFLDLINYCLEKENKVLDFIQYVAIYDFQWMVVDPELPDFFSESQINEFWEYVYKFLEYIDVDIIKQHRSIGEHVKNYLIFLKNRKDFSIYNSENLVLFKSGNETIAKLNNHKIWLDIVKFKNNILYISGVITSICKNDNLTVEAIKEEEGVDVQEKYIGKFFEYPTRQVRKYLSDEWLYKYSFDLKIPINPNQLSKINIYILYDEGDIHAKINGHFKYQRYCLFSDFDHYFVQNNQIIFYRSDTIYCEPYSYKHHVSQEIHSIYRILRDDVSLISAVLFRVFILFMYPFMKNKHIWLYADRPFSADDNATHLFKYAITQNDNAKKYFVICKDSKDYNKMKSISKNILKYGSLKHKFYYIFSEKMISAFIKSSFINPFYRNSIPYSGLFTADNYFLQHGIIKDDLSKNIKKYDKNLSLIVTSADMERDTFFEYKYNYDENVVQVLGLPRYDNLKNLSNNKIILFTPSWRSYIKNKDDLLNSEYFKLINSFLNNEKFFEILEKYDYTLIFRPHPELWQYLKQDIFEITHERIKISTEESYQDLFNNSSLLITDYSSVFFDFAYIKKPIIYYQVNEELYHYEKGYFDYKTMGFGEVIENEIDLVNHIEKLLQNDCKNDEKYLERIENFFKYTDKNNCKRVHDWIKND